MVSDDKHFTEEEHQEILHEYDLQHLTRYAADSSEQSVSLFNQVIVLGSCA